MARRQPGAPLLRQLLQQALCLANPDAVAFALEGRGVNIVGNHVAEFRESKVGLVAGKVDFRELHFGAGIGMIFGDPFPDGEGSVGLAEGGVGFGERHLRITPFVLGIFRDDALQQRQRFGRTFGAQETLTQVRSRVDVLGVARHGGAVAFLGFLEFALLKIDIAELRIMMRFVEVMYLRFELLDAPAVDRAGQFEATSGRWRGAIDITEIPKRGETPADEDEECPDPFALAHGIDEHPNLKDCSRQENRGG